MRKQNPRHAVDKFMRATDELQAYYTTVMMSFLDKPLERTILSILSEQTLFSLAVEWEIFVNDYFVAAVNRHSGTFRKSLRKRMRKSITDKFGDKASRYTQIGLPKHLSVPNVIALAAPGERNVTFTGAKELVAGAIE